MTWHLPSLWPAAVRCPRVFVHIGSHKTGTTSIQQVLLNTRRGIHYPVPNTMGPGHHEIAVSMASAGSEPSGRNTLLEMIRQQGWDRTGLPIVFSSETFSDDGVLPGAAARLAELADAMHAELIVTHRSIVSRLNSFFQERVKNSKLDHRDGSMVNWSSILNMPACAEDFFDRTVGMARWKRGHVVMVDKTNPRFLTEAFSSILGVTLARRQRPPEENASIPFPQLQMLIDLHREEPEADNADLLARSAKLFAELCRKDPARAAIPYPPIPRDVLEQAEGVDARQMIRLHDLEAAGRVVVHRPHSGGASR